MNTSTFPFLGAILFLLSTSALAAPCTVTDMASLRSCLNQGAAIDYYDIQSDFSCSGADCCAAGEALISLSGRNGVRIQGNNRVITRYGNQKVCPAITLHGATNIAINSLLIDEDASTPRCIGTDNCPPTIFAYGGSNFMLEGVGIWNAKASGVSVHIVDNFVLNNSTIVHAGILGFYAGAGSNHVKVQRSVIARSGANGVAFQNVVGGNTQEENLIWNNVLDSNHELGAYVTPSTSPNFANGGQIFVPYARSVGIGFNVIANGRCTDCRGWGPGGNQPGGGISAIELGNEGPLDFITIYWNKILNHYGPSFFVNGSRMNGNSAIYDNDSRGVLSQWYVRNGGNFKPSQGRNASGDYRPSAYSSGYMSGAIQRVYSSGFHQEANWIGQHAGALFERTFHLADWPLPRASNRPIYRCLTWTNTANDFPSLDPNCEGYYLHSILGYSYPASHPGAQPFYRCLIQSPPYDQFVSSDASCEGHYNAAFLGYFIPQ